MSVVAYSLLHEVDLLLCELPILAEGVQTYHKLDGLGLERLRLDFFPLSRGEVLLLDCLVRVFFFVLVILGLLLQEGALLLFLLLLFLSYLCVIL